MKIRIFAPSRSGHHAFINWLSHQIDESTIHHNNCVFGWEDKKLIANTGKKTTFKEAPFKHQIYSIEYFNLDDYDKFDFANWGDDYVDIIFLRDYYNWLASSIKAGENRFGSWTNRRGKPEMSVIELWKQYAEEFTNKSILKPNSHYVSYNDWHLSKDYRKEVCEALGFTFTDKGINKVPEFGGGSSYSNTKHNGQANEKLKTTERWANHKGDKNYINLIKNNMDCVELNESLFGMKLTSTEPLDIKQI